jgi:hypothetical protein
LQGVLGQETGTKREKLAIFQENKQEQPNQSS